MGMGDRPRELAPLARGGSTALSLGSLKAGMGASEGHIKFPLKEPSTETKPEKGQAPTALSRSNFYLGTTHTKMSKIQQALVKFQAIEDQRTAEDRLTKGVRLKDNKKAMARQSMMIPRERTIDGHDTQLQRGSLGLPKRHSNELKSGEGVELLKMSRNTSELLHHSSGT